MHLLRKFAAANLLGAGLLLVPAALASSAFAQNQPSSEPAQTVPAQNNAGQPSYKGQDHDNIQTSTSAGKEPTKTQYTEEQLVTSTVHQAWLLSGRNEANFVEIIEQIADISSHNRGVKLPDSAAAGRKMGEYIKQRARADTDELLYAIVDKAVLNATTDAPHHAVAKPAEASKAAPPAH